MQHDITSSYLAPSCIICCYLIYFYHFSPFYRTEQVIITPRNTSLYCLEKFYLTCTYYGPMMRPEVLLEVSSKLLLLYIRLEYAGYVCVVTQRPIFGLYVFCFKLAKKNYFCILSFQILIHVMLQLCFTSTSHSMYSV